MRATTQSRKPPPALEPPARVSRLTNHIVSRLNYVATIQGSVFTHLLITNI